MKHCVAARLVVLEIGEDSLGTHGHANGMSVAMIVRPMSIVCILDVENTREHENGIAVKLSDKCRDVLGCMPEIPDWYPQPDPDAEFPFSMFGGGPVTKKSRKKGQGKLATMRERQRRNVASDPRKNKTQRTLL